MATHPTRQPHRRPLPVTIDDVRAAHARIARRDRAHADAASAGRCRELTGATVYLKFENLQFTAAYKERGALNTLLQLRRGGARGRDRRVGRQSRAGPRLSRAPGSASR